MSVAELKRQLKIKAGSYARLKKEVCAYENEAKEQEERIARMRLQQSRVDADIRKQVDYLDLDNYKTFLAGGGFGRDQIDDT
jgi:hypothetical protein